MKLRTRILLILNVLVLVGIIYGAMAYLPVDAANPHLGVLSVEPNPATAGLDYSILGTNFPSLGTAKLSLCSPGCASAHNIPIDSNGNFEAKFRAGIAGKYCVTGVTFEEKGKSGKFKLKVHDSICWMVEAP